MKKWEAEGILAVLDRCCDEYSFPMLDNGYIYLAGTRLSLYRSEEDWAMVIEVFGFSPRAELPDTTVYTFASRIRNRPGPENYVNRAAFEKARADNPNNDMVSVFPLDEGPWQLDDDLETTAAAGEVVLRGRAIPLPPRAAYAEQGVELEEPDRVSVCELCRYLAAKYREEVLATPDERRFQVPAKLPQILQLEDWRHPDLADDERPSRSETFRMLAEVLATGDVAAYAPTLPPNTHWRNWPDGGTL